MNTRKFLPIVSLTLLMAVTLPASASYIVPDSSQSGNAGKTGDPRGEQLLQRLRQIKDMNKSAMSRTEKKELRKEIKEIRKEMRTSHKGLYLSVGAIIIIILLLILIL